MNALARAACVVCLSLSAIAEPGRSPEDALRAELETLRRELDFPGATAAFVLRDGTFGEVAVGLADRETGDPMTPRHGLLAASIGKTFVSAVALALAAENRLNLEAPISHWLGQAPWFSRLPQGASITVRHLLTHRAGVPDHVHQADFRAALQRRWRTDAPPFTAEELIGFVLDQPGACPPGAGWAYSDTGYVLLGLILEEVCGRPLYSEVTARFLEPLRLTRTRPSNQRLLPELAPGYTNTRNPFDFPVKSTDERGHLRWHPGIENFGGGWVSNAGDLARWGAALYAGEALPGAAREELHRTFPITNEPAAPRYGHGVSHYPEGPLGPTWGHGGWIPGYVSSLRHYSRHGLTVAFQINTDAVASATNWLTEMELRLAHALLP
ncbi:MAG: beta-lactamase family protein [Candidatus Marinimicrobia bacterium]|nr:beta-lactamase family protein [Candidatus Neomarinimicrobiota bacterium]